MAERNTNEPMKKKTCSFISDLCHNGRVRGKNLSLGKGGLPDSRTPSGRTSTSFLSAFACQEFCQAHHKVATHCVHHVFQQLCFHTLVVVLFRIRDRCGLARQVGWRLAPGSLAAKSTSFTCF